MKQKQPLKNGSDKEIPPMLFSEDGNTVYITEYIGMFRFPNRDVYSFSKRGDTWFARKRHTKNVIVIDEVK